MSDDGDPRERSDAPGWQTYKCPVCSHTDGVLLAGADRVLIRCSHCDTPLEVSEKGGPTASARVLDTRRREERERA